MEDITKEIEELYGIKTSCKECVFAMYVGKTQMDCSLGRLDKFREGCVPVIESYDEDDKEFFVIERFCNTYRPEDWKPRDKKMTKEDSVLKEAQPTFDFIIIHDSSKDIGSLEKTLSDIKQQAPLPKRVVVVEKGGKDKMGIIGVLERHLSDLPVSYRYVVYMDDEYEGSLDFIDESFKQVDSMYYCVLDSSKDVIANIIKRVDTIINQDMRPLSVIKPDEGYHGLVVQSILHQELLPEAEDRNILRKIIELSESTGEQGFIFYWKSL
ncbi:MAG: hypothetical protein CL489_03690 [Acidobacteria bacterium]|nr:hypothetical protein [Acidobacteriota bacterium]